MSEPALPRPRHELRDVTARVIWPLIGCMAGMVLFAWAVTWLEYPGALHGQQVKSPAPLFPEPRLQPNPEADMAAFRARENAELDSYGWVDRPHGIVHVPIEQAMHRLAQDGIPGWQAESGR